MQQSDSDSDSDAELPFDEQPEMCEGDTQAGQALDKASCNLCETLLINHLLPHDIAQGDVSSGAACMYG